MMPKRMLRDWTDSKKFEALSPEAERLFTRLIMRADDYGRFYAEPRMLKANCFPRVDTILPKHTAPWLEELRGAGLLICYLAKGETFLAIVNFNQRLKHSVPRFPAISGEDEDWLPEHETDFRELPGTSGNTPELPAVCRRDVEANVEEEGRGESAASVPVVSQKRKTMTDIPKELQSVEFSAAWDGWLMYLREKRSPITSSTATLQLRKLKKIGIPMAIVTIERSIESGWKGLFPKDKPPAPDHNGANPSGWNPVEPDAQILAELARGGE